MPEAIARDGIRIHYESSGTGRAVILLHPNRATSRSWIDFGWFAALERAGFRAVSLDARGYGESTPVASPDQLAAGTSTDDIESVMNDLGIEAAPLCGFSLGAATAVRFAVDRPGRVRSLVLGGLARGPLAQCGLHVDADPERGRQRALEEVEWPLRNAAGSERCYFEAVRAVIATTPLRSLAAADLRCAMLAVAGARDPLERTSIYEAIRAAGARLESITVPAVGHGECFVHPAFRMAAVEFVARAR